MAILIQDIIAKKRDQTPLGTGDINAFVSAVTDNDISEGQIAAFCMAVLLNGMNLDERVALTRSMAQSGITIDWSTEGLDGPVLDKHSTGGVGDKVSLILAPIIAACGGYVPMISGRGLGHTGGTLDKLDAIPGYQSEIDTDRFKTIVKQTGCAIVSASANLAPADKRIYAVRDVTATVESMDLIVASILSKKLAAGLDALVMDVKFGTGAFMQDYDDAKTMAENLVRVANGAGLKTHAVMSDMNQVLGGTAGNALETREAITFLTGTGQDPRLLELIKTLATEMLMMGDLAKDKTEALGKVKNALSSGQAAEKFAAMVHALGGPTDICDKAETHLKLAPVCHEVHAREAGIVTAIDTKALGMAVIALGGGRRKPDDVIDYGVGLASIAAIGDKVAPQDRPLAVVYAKTHDDAAAIEQNIKRAFTIDDDIKTKPSSIIRDIITH